MNEIKPITYIYKTIHTVCQNSDTSNDFQFYCNIYK